MAPSLGEGGKEKEEALLLLTPAPFQAQAAGFLAWTEGHPLLALVEATAGRHDSDSEASAQDPKTTKTIP